MRDSRSRGRRSFRLFESPALPAPGTERCTFRPPGSFGSESVERGANGQLTHDRRLGVEQGVQPRVDVARFEVTASQAGKELMVMGFGSGEGRLEVFESAGRHSLG